MSITDVSEVKRQLTDISSIQKQQGILLKEMLSLLKGNPLDPKDEGMLGDIRASKQDIVIVKTEVAELQQDKKVTKRTIAVLATAFTLFVGIVQIVIKVYFK
jgi:hypothetical protein